MQHRSTHQPDVNAARDQLAIQPDVLRVVLVIVVAAQAPNVAVAKPAEVPADVRFDAIYSNPPVRVGKLLLHELLLQWLPRLKPGGVAYLVVQRNLGSDSLAKWLAEQGFGVTRLKSKKGYRILEVKPHT